MKKEAEPLEYIRGFTEFLGVKIDLSKKPLIPRSETEFWVSQALRYIKPGARILDIFCGSGCIGLAIERHIKGAQVYFADKHQYFNHPNFVKSDIFSNIKGKYDYIFANPPYVARKKIKQVQKSVLQHEPNSALFAGQDGLFIIKKFLKQAKEHLSIDGRMFMEFSPEQKPAIEKLLKKFGYKKWELHKDQFDRCRWVVIE